MKSEKNKNKNDASENNALNIHEHANLRIEVEKFITGAEEAMKHNGIEPQFDTKLKEKQKAREILLREIISDNNYDNLLSFILKKIKNITDYEITLIKLTDSIEDMNKTNNIFLDSHEKEKKKLLDITNHNQILLTKVKDLNDENIKMEREEKQKKMDIEKKCEDFKKEVTEKFNSNFPELERLKEENASLRQKIENLKSKIELDNISSIYENTEELGNIELKNFLKDKEERINLCLDKILDYNSENLDFYLHNLIENDKNILLSIVTSLEGSEDNEEEKRIVRLKQKYNYILQIRNLMKENKKMKDENAKVSDEIKKIKQESEIADLNLAKIRYEFEQGKIESIRVN